MDYNMDYIDITKWYVQIPLDDIYIYIYNYLFYIYIYMVTPPYDPPMCHLYCYLQHKMRISSIPFLSSSYIVITIQYLKALSDSSGVTP